MRGAVELATGYASSRQQFGRSVGSFQAVQHLLADALVLMLIGHGSFDGVDYKINLPGPDLSAIELAGLLDRIPAGRQLVVNMTSASG